MADHTQHDGKIKGGAVSLGQTRVVQRMKASHRNLKHGFATFPFSTP